MAQEPYICVKAARRTADANYGKIPRVAIGIH